MIGVGINENVMLSGAHVDDKSRLVLQFSPAKAAEEKKSLFDEALTAGIQKDSKADLSLTIFPPLISKKTDITDAKKAELVHSDLRKLNNQLTQICQQYMVTADIDFSSMAVKFAGTSVTDAESYERLLLDQDTVNRIYENVAKRFVELVTPFVGDPKFPVRLKLIRQSKEKHYATLPSRFIEEQPFIELMIVPAEASKVRFSEWEKSQKLDSREVYSSDNTENKSDGTSADAGGTAPLSSNPFAE